MFVALGRMVGIVHSVRSMPIRDQVSRALHDLRRAGHQHERDQEGQESAQACHEADGV